MDIAHALYANVKQCKSICSLRKIIMKLGLFLLIILSINLVLVSCGSLPAKKRISELTKIAIVDDAPDEFSIYKRKLMPSENKFDISTWKMGGYLSNKVVALAKINAPTINFHIEDIQNEVSDGANKLDPLVCQELMDKGYDGAMIIGRSGASRGGMKLIPKEKGGFVMFVTYSLAGKEYREIIALYSLSLYSLKSCNRVSYSAQTENRNLFQDGVHVKEHNQYTEGELEVIRNSLIDSIDSTVGRVVNGLF